VNPFTRFLLGRQEKRSEPKSAKADLEAFVEHWDAFEALVIRVFKAKAAGEADEIEHAQVRRWLLEHFPRWQASLAAHWPGKRAGGEPLEADPFAWLLQIERADGFVMNWRAMQMLPAARETLNEYLMGERKD
jgi:hypothetical protein